MRIMEDKLTRIRCMFPITSSRTKKIKEAMQELIQAICVHENIFRIKTNASERFVKSNKMNFLNPSIVST